MRTARLTKIAMVIFLSMIFFLGVQKPVLAAGKNTTVKIPVEQIFEVNNSADADKTGSYVLIADQIQNPMPEGSNRRTFTWNMSGNSSTELIMNVGQVGEGILRIERTTMESPFHGENAAVGVDGQVFGKGVHVFGIMGDHDERNAAILKNAVDFLAHAYAQ